MCSSSGQKANGFPPTGEQTPTEQTRPLRLTLAILEAFARAGLAVFLAFPHAGVARQQAGGLQGRTQRRVYVQQRPRYSVADGASLAGWPAAFDAHADVVLADAFG